MVIFVLTSAKIKPHMGIFTFLESENIFILHQKMRETSQNMRETVNESTKNEKRDWCMPSSQPQEDIACCIRV